MKRVLMTPALMLAAIASVALAQGQGQGQGQAKAPSSTKAPPPPPLMECGAHGDIEILCGTRSPEDLELTPDGKFLVVPNFVGAGRGPANPNAPGPGIQLFDINAKTYAKLNITSEPRKDWGDDSCPGPIGEALVGHGISLAKRNGGAWELYVVNHGGGRQSMEMFELKQAAGSWGLIWHGCMVSKNDFNDVAALPDGGFIATHPTGAADTRHGSLHRSAQRLRGALDGG